MRALLPAIERTRIRRHRFTPPVLMVAVLAAACAEFQPLPVEDTGLLHRAETQTRENVTVTVAVPTVDEARQLFDFDLHKKSIQPVWIEIRNHTANPVWFHPYSLDPDYYSPHEVAWLSHRTGSGETNQRIDAYFRDQTMPYFVPAGEDASGFVFASYKFGTRYVPLELNTATTKQPFEFFLNVPDSRTDHDLVNFEVLYSADEIADLEDETAVRRWAGQLQCCTANAAGTRSGDPINFVIIASEFVLKRAFLRVGWDETAALTVGAAAKTAAAVLTDSAYKNAPMSSLYVFDRRQDIGLQKARHNVHQRNHLRLWLAPVTYRSTPIWAGQISRDIGSRATSRSATLTTHKIDPNTDDVRDGLVHDLYAAKVIDAYGFVNGVGRSTHDEPRENLTGDPFYTDGQRVVLFLLEEAVPTQPVRYLKWDEPS